MTGAMAEPSVERYQHDIPEGFSNFDPEPFVHGAQEWVDGLVGQRQKVGISVSGGVDSTTAAHLLGPVLGNRLHLYFIDDGLRRIRRGISEADIAADMFRDFDNFEVINTAADVLPRFDGISDGTQKREMFRELYVDASNQHLNNLDVDWIADGTIAPDIVMTDQKRQTQHNVDLPYQSDKLEPLAPLYKPHVRKVAMQLGMPKEFAMQIPCPGPAQLLRVGGAFSEEKLKKATAATDIVEQMVEEYCKKIWSVPFQYDEATGVRTPFQYFATCLDPEMEEDRDLSLQLHEFAATGYIMGTNAMWIDNSVAAQEQRLYAPIVWIDGPPLAATRMKEVYKETNEIDTPRVLYEVFRADHDEGHPIGIKIVESEDVRTAWPMEFGYYSLKNIGEAISEATGAPRVGYDISPRPPATIELF
jgi:GMP synthase (glutamine-hydrolysing)